MNFVEDCIFVVRCSNTFTSSQKVQHIHFHNGNYFCSCVCFFCSIFMLWYNSSMMFSWCFGVWLAFWINENVWCCWLAIACDKQCKFVRGQSHDLSQTQHFIRILFTWIWRNRCSQSTIAYIQLDDVCLCVFLCVPITGWCMDF